jgi:uncharacterized protein (DUF2267 family)
MFVQERADLSGDDAAATAIRAVFGVLSMMMTPGQAEALAETLPLEIREHVTPTRWRHYFDREQFLERIAGMEGVDPATAEQHAAAVLSVLADYLPSPALLAALDDLPREIRALFAWTKKAA